MSQTEGGRCVRTTDPTPSWPQSHSHHHAANHYRYHRRRRHRRCRRRPRDLETLPQLSVEPELIRKLGRTL